MRNPLRCQCCETKDREIIYLRGLVDRLMVQIAPKPEGAEDIKIIPESDE